MSVIQLGNTIAYLHDTSGPVTNTFAGGAITIILNEAKVDVSGKAPDGTNRVTENNYSFLSETVVDKDPTVTVLSGSEDCYVFIIIENELPDSFAINYNVSASGGSDTEYWTKVAKSGNKTVYAYSEKVENISKDTALEPLFTKVTMPALTSDEIRQLGTKTIILNSYAVQTDGFDESAAVKDAVAALGLGTDSIVKSSFLAK